jgi:hypothetical protein
MNMFLNEIKIAKCNNGWMVEMPPTPPADDMMKMNQMAKSIGAVIGKLNQDEILSRVESEIEKEEAEANKQEMPAVQINPTLHVFKTFAEVLKFLKDVVK